MLKVCIGYTFFYIMLSFFFLFSKKKMYKKDILLLILFLISLLIISAFCIPSKTDDLYRHYKLITQIREWEIDLIDTYTIYSGQFLPIWGITLYYLARLPHYFWLIVLYTGISFTTLFLSIMFINNNHLLKKEVSIFLFYFFAINSLFSINSGIRNQCVFGFGTLLFYLYMYGKIRSYFIIPIFIILGFIHPAAYIIPICYLFSLVIKKNSWVILLWVPITKYFLLPILNILLNKFSYLAKILEKLNYYFYQRKYDMDIRQLIAILILLIILIYINSKVKNNGVFENKFYYKYYFFYMLVLMITIGSIGTSIFLRFSYIVAWFSLPSFILFIRNSNKNKLILGGIVIIISVMLNIYNGITLITYTQFGII